MDLRLRGAGVLVTGESRHRGCDCARLRSGRRKRRDLRAERSAWSERRPRSVPEAWSRSRSPPTSLDGRLSRRRRHTAAAFGRLDVISNAAPSIDKTPASIEEASDAQVLERLGKMMAAVRCSRAARRTRGGRRPDRVSAEPRREPSRAAIFPAWDRPFHRVSGTPRS